VQRDGLVDRVRSQGEILLSDVREAVGKFDAVGDIRGRGHFIGIEFVSDRATKKAFDPALQLTEKFRARTLEAGMICYPVSGTIDGVGGDVAIIAPPYIASRPELDEIIDKLVTGVSNALADINAA
jgi:adenosylmethionine-8-amino-7-oxononanoate aminotransferase